MRHRRIGIDVGATGIKGAVVDLDAGGTHPMDKAATPSPAAPEAVAKCVGELVAPWDCPGPVGVALPCTVENGVARTAVNIPSEWVEKDAKALFAEQLGRDVVVLNDADAAGIAEVRHGVADYPGTVLVLTFGTGVGSAVLRGGRLEPNVELGQLPMNGQIAEKYVSLSARQTGQVSWSEWVGRVNAFLEMIEEQRRYDLIVIGGGLTHETFRWQECLVARAPLVRAHFLNMAGVVGAALAAEFGADAVFRRPRRRRSAV